MAMQLLYLIKSRDFSSSISQHYAIELAEENYRKLTFLMLLYLGQNNERNYIELPKSEDKMFQGSSPFLQVMCISEGETRKFILTTSTD
jgi:hypothetical protein